MVEAGIARDPEQPRLENLDRLEPLDSQYHLYESSLRDIFPFTVVAQHRSHESPDAPLVALDNRANRGLFSCPRPLDRRGEIRRGLMPHRRAKVPVAHPAVRGSRQSENGFA